MPTYIDMFIFFLYLQAGDMTYLYEGKDDCTYYFEWYTTAACPITVLEGSDCKIEDTRAGVSSDPWLARSGFLCFSGCICSGAGLL
jgi:hypothetical protein